MRSGSDKKVLVFVYGSLLSGLGNHYRLDGSTFIGEDSIRAKLFTSNWHWPFIVFSNSNKDRVDGEVYEVTYHEVIYNLDHLESYYIHHSSTHSTDCRCLFIRKKATTKLGRKVWIYEGGNTLKSFDCTPLIGNWRKAKFEH